MFMVFGSFNPGWTCLDDPPSNGTALMGNATNISMFTIHKGWNVSGNTDSGFDCYNMKTCNNISFNKEASTVVTKWALVCENSWPLPVIISIQMAGVALGSYLGGQVGEKLGRKVSIYGSLAIMVVMNVVAVFSVSWEMYAFVLFFTGLANGCILSSLIVLVIEFLNTWWRGFIGAFPFWNVATLSFALCVLVLKDWKHVHLSIAALSLISFLPVFWVPESMRFLTVHGNITEANKVVRKIAKWNKKPLPNTSILNTIAEEEKKIMNKTKQYTYLDLFRKPVRKTNIILGLTWLILSIGYFVVGFGIKSLYGDFFVNFLLYSVVSIPMRIVAAVLATKVGRKFTSAFFVCLTCGCSLSVVVIQLLAPLDIQGTATAVMALGASMMTEAGWGVVVVLVVELNPTSIRNLAYGYCNGLARTGSIIAPFLIPRETFPMFGAFLLLGLLQLVGFLGILMLHETKNKPLQDNLLKKPSRINNRPNEVSQSWPDVDTSSRSTLDIVMRV
ncbi:unnamed protein product [Candidula unifasciata]|uniref:Major facilitator superfamily (MFS) profile domain-containing protein n=1 Tax=Candidula unifasciata TaxID=100452 RepID=A0A8S3ZD17_9EUPU|nr:unnamed protein product [Candidula unifasciata]